MPDEIVPAAASTAPPPEAQVPAPEPEAAPAQPAPASPPAPARDAAADSEARPADAAPNPATLESMLSPGEEAPKGGDASDGGAEAAGEAFSVEIPEGFVADREAVGALEGLVKDGKIDKDMAAGLARQHMESVRRYEASLVANAQNQVREWEDEIRADPKYGGVHLDASVERAKTLLHKYATPKMVADFQRVGVLSHPDFFAMLNRLHGEVSEGASVGGAGQATAETDPARVLYPNFK